MIRSSRTTVAQQPPLEWLHYRDSKILPPAVVGEIAQELSLLGPADRQMLFAEIQDRMADAAAGQAGYPHEVAEIVRNTEVWELRWRVQNGTKRLYRLYFGEPALHGTLLVSLRFHLKQTEVENVNKAQTAHIAVAIDRYRSGASRMWG